MLKTYIIFALYMIEKTHIIFARVFNSRVRYLSLLLSLPESATPLGR